MQKLTVEAPHEAAALALTQRLAGVAVEVVPLAGDARELRIGNGRESIQDLVSIFNAIERWLVAERLPSASIVVDGRQHTLVAPDPVG
jgi:hypothetical protein